MTFLKSLWRKLFKAKKSNMILMTEYWHKDGTLQYSFEPVVYDPSEDPEKILKGEFESYFE